MELKNVKGIGPKTLKRLNDEEIFTVDDLVLNFPKKYDIFEVTNSSIYEGNFTSVHAKIISRPYFIKYRGNVTTAIFYSLINNNKIKCVLFSSDYLRYTLKNNLDVILCGRYKDNEFFVKNIFFDTFSVRIDTKYNIDGVKDYIIKDAVANILETYEKEDYLPLELQEKYKLLDYKSYLKKAHFPESKKDFIEVQRRGKYEEFFWYSIALENLRLKRSESIKEKRLINENILNNFINNLDYKLTPDQLKAISDVKEDIKRDYPMNRLIQGDVGCGKSIIAYAGALMEISSGYQVVIMMPTELLANQQYESIKKAFSNYNLSIELLTSSIKNSVKDDIKYRLENGRINIIVGTHALIEESVRFFKLGLAIIDEQHKFGVNQRKRLISKFKNVDSLYLTATPIPRTLGLTAFGDLDITSVHTMPDGRSPILTLVYDYKGLREIFKMVKKHIDLKEQIYVIAPLVNENPDLDLYDINSAKKLIEKYIPDAKIGVVHGQMKSSLKDEIMNDFYNKYYNILLATTVIEVGINVPNATMMIILDAERYGLAQIHQLRGRVGRGNLKSCCILVSKDKENERLNILKNTQDGFEIAINDFKLRGPGDYLGESQSGLANLEYASFIEDIKIWNVAQEDAKAYALKFEKDIVKNKKYLEIIKSNEKQRGKIN